MAALAQRGVKSALLKPLAWVVAALGVLALCGLLWGSVQLWLHFHDQAVVEADRAKSAAEFRKRQVQAERAAGAAKDERDQVNDQDQAELEGMVDAAKNDGTSAADPVWRGMWSEPED